MSEHTPAEHLADLIGKGHCSEVVKIYNQNGVDPDDPHALYQSYLAHAMMDRSEEAKAIRALLPGDMMHDASRDELLAMIRQGRCDDPVWQQNVAFWHLLVTSTTRSGGFKIDDNRLDSWKTTHGIPQIEKQLAATACLLPPVGYTKTMSQHR